MDNIKYRTDHRKVIFMGIFQKLRLSSHIDEGVRRFGQTENGVLLDVRREDEYGEGHIPGSRNLPLSRLEQAKTEIPDRDTPLFVYCLSGGRSRKAAEILKGMGYTSVENIGGIQQYHGELEE